MPQPNTKSPWWAVLILSVVVVVGLSIFSSEFRAVAYDSVSSVWVFLGLSFLFVIDAGIMIWNHRNEKKTIQDTFSILIEYLQSSAFVRPAVLVYSIFLIVLVVKVPLKMRELSTQLDSARKLSTGRPSKKAEPPLTLSQATNAFKAETDRIIAKQAEERKKYDAALLKDGGDNALKSITDREIHFPQFELRQDGKLDSKEIARATAVMDEFSLKQAAEAELARRRNAPYDGLVISYCAPLVDYYVGVLTNALADLAKGNGLQIYSTYTNAIALSNLPQTADYALIGIQNHPSWELKVYFRQQSSTNHFHWHIYGEGLDFTCQFSGKDYKYWLIGGPPGLSNEGSGEIKSLSTTNFAQALLWLIAAQQSKHPLTNQYVKQK